MRVTVAAAVVLCAIALVARAQSTTTATTPFGDIPIPAGARTDPLRPYLVEVRLDFGSSQTAFPPFSSTRKINAFYKRYALQDTANATAILVKQRLTSLEPADGSVVKYVFYFRRDIVGAILADFQANGTARGGFFEAEEILFMAYHLQYPADQSTLAKCHVMGWPYAAYTGRSTPIYWCSIDWIVGLVIAMTIFLAFELLAWRVCRSSDGPHVVMGVGAPEDEEAIAEGANPPYGRAGSAAALHSQQPKPFAGGLSPSSASSAPPQSVAILPGAASSSPSGSLHPPPLPYVASHSQQYAASRSLFSPQLASGQFRASPRPEPAGAPVTVV